MGAQLSDKRSDSLDRRVSVAPMMASNTVSFPRARRAPQHTCETEPVYGRWQGVVCRDGRPIAKTGATYRTEREALQGAHEFCRWQGWRLGGVSHG